MQRFMFKSGLIFCAAQYNGPAYIARNDTYPPLPAGMQWNTFGITLVIWPVLVCEWGNEPVNPTDWIVDAVDGTRHRMSDKLFKLTCQPAAL